MAICKVCDGLFTLHKPKASLSKYISMHEHMIMCICHQMGIITKPAGYNRARDLGCIVLYNSNRQPEFYFTHRSSNTWDIYDNRDIQLDTNLAFYDIYLFICDLAVN